MPPINGLNAAAAVAPARTGEPPISFEVNVPSARPTRAQIADAFFAHFGFTRDDTAFLRQHSRGVDPFAYFARTLRFDPRSVTAQGGQSRIRLEVSARLRTPQAIGGLTSSGPD